MKKIYLLLIISFSFFSCRKEIEEPKNNTKNDNYVYLEIDGERFMVEDRKFNLNKNTRGSFDSQSVSVQFDQDTLIRVSSQANNLDAGNKKKFRVLKMGINLFGTKKIGAILPNSMQISAKCYTSENKYYDFSIERESSQIPVYENKSFKESKIMIKEFNQDEGTIEILISGQVENYYDGNNLVPVFIKINLKNNRNI